MAIVLVEGFDHLSATAQTQLKGWAVNVGTGSPGRFGGQYGLITPNTLRGKSLPSTYSTIIVGFAALFTGDVTTTNSFFAICAGGTNTLQLHFSAGKIVIKNSGGTTIATGFTSFATNVWHYIEVKLFVNSGTPASGTCELHLDGVAGEIVSTTGNFGSTNVDNIKFANNSISGQIQIDDIYVAETGSAPNNTFLGDTRVQTIYPSGAGSTTQWNPLSGANWQNVDEVPPDGDTTYNFDSTVGQLDSFITPGIDSTANVFTVQTNLYSRKDNTGSRQISDLIRQSGTNYVGATTDTLTSNYLFYSNIWNQDPTNSNWTAVNINADEFGYKLIA